MSSLLRSLFGSVKSMDFFAGDGGFDLGEAEAFLEEITAKEARAKEDQRLGLEDQEFNENPNQTTLGGAKDGLSLDQESAGAVTETPDSTTDLYTPPDSETTWLLSSASSSLDDILDDDKSYRDEHGIETDLTSLGDSVATQSPAKLAITTLPYIASELELPSIVDGTKAALKLEDSSVSQANNIPENDPACHGALEDEDHFTVARLPHNPATLDPPCEDMTNAEAEAIFTFWKMVNSESSISMNHPQSPGSVCSEDALFEDALSSFDDDEAPVQTSSRENLHIQPSKSAVQAETVYVPESQAVSTQQREAAKIMVPPHPGRDTYEQHQNSARLGQEQDELRIRYWESQDQETLEFDDLPPEIEPVEEKANKTDSVVEQLKCTAEGSEKKSCDISPHQFHGHIITYQELQERYGKHKGKDSEGLPPSSASPSNSDKTHDLKEDAAKEDTIKNTSSYINTILGAFISRWWKSQKPCPQEPQPTMDPEEPVEHAKEESKGQQHQTTENVWDLHVEQLNMRTKRKSKKKSKERAEERAREQLGEQANAQLKGQSKGKPKKQPKKLKQQPQEQSKQQQPQQPPKQEPKQQQDTPLSKGARRRARRRAQLLGSQQSDAAAAGHAAVPGATAALGAAVSTQNVAVPDALPTHNVALTASGGKSTRPPFPGKVVKQSRFLAYLYAKMADNPPEAHRKDFGPQHLVVWADGSWNDHQAAFGVVYRLDARKRGYDDWREHAYVLPATDIRHVAHVETWYKIEPEIIAVETALALAVDEVKRRNAKNAENGEIAAVTKVTVFTDSMTALNHYNATDVWEWTWTHNCFVRGWPLAEQLRALGVALELRWSPGHSGLAGNERADEVARLALRRGPRLDRSMRLRDGVLESPMLRVPVSMLRASEAMLETLSGMYKENQAMADVLRSARLVFEHESKEMMRKVAVAEGWMGEY